DRAKAQLVMDHQRDQINQLLGDAAELHAQVETLRLQLKEQKRILSAAKKSCRKNGRCFRIQTGPKIERSLGEKIRREVERVPRNVAKLWSRGAPSPEPAPAAQAKAASVPTPADRYAAWIREHEADSGALAAQREEARAWVDAPKISLLLPVFDTPANLLEKMLTSIAAQTYENWEACVVDGGSTHPETITTLARWGKRDPRIRVHTLAENKGIAGNTNAALTMATGDFVTCVDHDDLLALFALFAVARAQAEAPEAEIFYSDEDRLTLDGRRHTPFFKPGWSPELLCSSMYLGHLTVYRRALVTELGGFRKEFDLSQDYDLALRATERATRIVHIPHVLYHWREHPASGSMGGKPKARETNLAALAEAMRRRHLPAEILELPTANRARLKLDPWPRVSVIVPTDSITRARVCAAELRRRTEYPEWELVLVTNSGVIQGLKESSPAHAPLRLVPYDKPFNFSDKCNAGVAVATGQIVIFLNDDVEATEGEWIQNVIEQLQNPEVGAVSPKLLYETGKIQHAGLVMGVRGLAGTAFHEQPADTTMHANLAQSLRDVAALSGACLAMRRTDFLRLGGFDSHNTPIAHSDIDLCFKVREAGLRCVYTPFTSLRHAGHVSIGLGKHERERARPRDKASIYLLRRWGEYITRDPYFTDNMRDWLYADSPTPIRMSARNQPQSQKAEADLLFVSHDLSLSGAPRMLLHAALSCLTQRLFAMVMSPEDGPLRAEIEAAGIPLIIDPLVLTGHESFTNFARNFDAVIANTIFGAPVIHSLQGKNVPLLWWLHETQVGEHYLREEAQIRSALPLADLLFAPSERAASVYRSHTDRPVKRLRNAIPELKPTERSASAGDRMQFVLLGTVEPRKGQDVLLQALRLLPVAAMRAAEIKIVGRVHDPAFGARIAAEMSEFPNVSMTGGVNHERALQLIQEADVVLLPSRDEAMPTVTMLEAMSLGKAIITTTVGGALEFLTNEENALLVRSETPSALADAMQTLISDCELVRELGRGARVTFEGSFTLERFAEEFRELVLGAIAAHSGQPISSLLT
ncbi:MAG: glycosyltransferase, partial [Chthoniobacterales bacterium]